MRGPRSDYAAPPIYLSPEPSGPRPGVRFSRQELFQLGVAILALSAALTLANAMALRGLYPGSQLPLLIALWFSTALVAVASGVGLQHDSDPALRRLEGVGVEQGRLRRHPGRGPGALSERSIPRNHGNLNRMRAHRVIWLARYPAPNPLSMLTTATPGAHAFIIPRRAAIPSKLAPYPTDVGTAMTGTSTRPATTLGRAPSMPATTTITFAFCKRSRRSRTRCTPATPTSYRRVTLHPISSAVTPASSATGTSE